jgi:fructokinase
MSAVPVILAFGEVLWDVFPTGARFGGAPANFACHAALQGAKTFVLSAVGDDERGREARAILQGFSVDVSALQTHPSLATGAVTVTLDAKGKPSYCIEPDAAWDEILISATAEAALEVADAVYFGTLGQRGQASKSAIKVLLQRAKEKGKLRVLDVNLRRPFYDAALIHESISQCDVLKFSDEELPELLAACGILSTHLDAQLKELLERFDLRLVAMTQGSDGATLLTAKECVRQPGVPTNVVDTVGAGDSFTATLIVGLLRGESLSVIAKKACEVASIVCSQSGAVPTLSSL